MNWTSRKVLVTGANGFIGSHLTERLVTLGADVRAFCQYNSNGSWGWLDDCPPDTKDAIDARLGDVRDSRFVENAILGVDVVFHLAALIAIPYSYAAPESFVETNIKGTLNVLEGARRSGCDRVVHASTSEVYGTPASIPIRETHPLQGQSPYSASKIAADKLCEAYHASFSVPVVVVRPFNTYGPRQSTRAVLPTILVQLLRGDREVRLGRLDTKRDLTFVTDTVEGFVSAGSKERLEGEVIQLGTGRMVSVAEMFEAARAALGVEATVKQEEARFRPEASEVEELLSDPAKARRLLDWSATVTLEDGLRRTAHWLEQNLHLYDSGRYHV